LHLQNGDATFAIFVCNIWEFALAKNNCYDDDRSAREERAKQLENARVQISFTGAA
jgi:hypothetical protein